MNQLQVQRPEPFSQYPATQTEVKIGKTVFRVTSVYKGRQLLEKVLLDWAMNKTLNAS